MRFELHCHSTCSDGTEEPARVAARAAASAVAVFALTDHDTCAGSAVTVAGARTLRAVELSCDEAGRTVHVLAFDRGGAWDAIEERLARVRVARKNRIRVMAAKLAGRGIRIDIEPLVAEADRRSLGRPDVARLLVAAKVVTSVKEAFSRFLYDGGPIDVPHSALPLADALALGRAAGAAMALAHPHLYDDRSAALVRRYQAEGLTGIEAFYGGYDARERARWTGLADGLGLVCTGGSDWHGPAAPGEAVQLGVELPADRSDALLRWLA